MDYTALSKSPLKEIHFVDTNIEMVKVLHETFQSMIPRGYIPKSYNKFKYVKAEVPHNLGKGKSDSHNLIWPLFSSPVTLWLD